jgi:hypothetical protein
MCLLSDVCFVFEMKVKRVLGAYLTKLRRLVLAMIQIILHNHDLNGCHCMWRYQVLANTAKEYSRTQSLMNTRGQTY